MDDGLISLAEQRVHARPTSEEEARAALEWIAGREGKTLGQLVEEIRQPDARWIAS
ncbi:MAG: hypothetical protein QOI03_1303 [Solirubrobacteraceae bacterium]|jgi:hypothetical protein|nr:hypothetical protein [Solirubrobacteraceae bacterium]